jgi:hypothetical protein
MNLFSAFSGALTVALAERVLRRLRVGPWAALGALGLLTCAPFFWGLSLIAEVYTLHTALMAALILLLLRWADSPTPRRLALVGLTMGLSLSHHAATVLLIPGCVWYVVTAVPRRAHSSRALILGLGAFLLGLSVYLYLPLVYGSRPDFNYAGFYDGNGAFRPINLRTLDGFWWLVSGRAFAGRMFATTGSALWGEIAGLAVELWRAFFVIGIGPGLVGLVVLLRRDWRLGGMLSLMLIGNATFYTTYRAGDKVTMFLPIYLIWALWLGVGYQWLLDWIKRGTDAAHQRMSVWLLRVVIIGVVLIALVWNWPLVDLSDDWSARAHGEEILDQLEPKALVFGWWDTVPVIQYLQLVEGQRLDVQAVNRFLISYDAMRAWIEREVSQRPVYTDMRSADLLQRLKAEPAGAIFRLRPRD